MAKLRTINVDLNRQYRNDLNWNFQQIEALTGTSISEIARVERESKERDDFLAGTDVEAIIQRIDTSANNADVQAQHAKVQGDYAKDQGDYAKQQGDYAGIKGDYADEKAVLADLAAANANNEASNLSQLKVDVVDATQRANAEADNANQAASDANAAAIYAKSQGDYAKQQGDAVQDIIDAGGTVASVNGQTGVVVLDADDVGAIPASKEADLATKQELLSVDNQVTTHEAVKASLTQSGHVRLSSSINSESEDLSATSKAVSVLNGLKKNYLHGVFANISRTGWHRIMLDIESGSGQRFGGVILIAATSGTGSAGGSIALSLNSNQDRKELKLISAVTSVSGIKKVRLVDPKSAWSSGNYLDIYMETTVPISVNAEYLHQSGNTLKFTESAEFNPEVPAGFRITEVILQ